MRLVEPPALQRARQGVSLRQLPREPARAVRTDRNGGRGQLRCRGRGQFAAAPRRLLAPVRAVPHGGAELERVARANAGHYLVVKVNTDVVTEVAARFTIRSIPTLALVFNGREIDRVTGVRPASDIEAFAKRALAAATPRAS